MCRSVWLSGCVGVYAQRVERERNGGEFVCLLHRHLKDHQEPQDARREYFRILYTSKTQLNSLCVHVYIQNHRLFALRVRVTTG